MNKDLSILVVCGGISSEREISLKSGKSIYEALKRSGYSNVNLFDLNRSNMQDILIARPAIVFIALHGKGGEDGSIQGMLELAGIPYTGPGIAASAICMNKILTKRILQNAGLPTAEFLAFGKDEVEGRIENVKTEASDTIGYPMVLKSPCEGSSIGVVIIQSEDEFEDAVNEVFSHGNELLIEEFIKGTEVTLPIMGNETITTLPVIEITSEREFYDYTAKYTKGLCHHIIPACIDKESEKEIIRIGRKVYQILGCRGLSRVDYIVHPVKGPLVIEVNTLPGMTDMSLFPDAARYIGISYEALVEKILEYGLAAKGDLNNN